VKELRGDLHPLTKEHNSLMLNCSRLQISLRPSHIPSSSRMLVRRPLIVMLRLIRALFGLRPPMRLQCSSSIYYLISSAC
jgi:hypothetical protein